MNPLEDLSGMTPHERVGYILRISGGPMTLPGLAERIQVRDANFNLFDSAKQYVEQGLVERLAENGCRATYRWIGQSHAGNGASLPQPPRRAAVANPKAEAQQRRRAQEAVSGTSKIGRADGKPTIRDRLLEVFRDAPTKLPYDAIARLLPDVKPGSLMATMSLLRTSLVLRRDENLLFWLSGRDLDPPPDWTPPSRLPKPTVAAPEEQESPATPAPQEVASPEVEVPAPAIEEPPVPAAPPAINGREFELRSLREALDDGEAVFDEALIICALRSLQRRREMYDKALKALTEFVATNECLSGRSLA